MAYDGSAWTESEPTNSTLANEIDDVARDMKIGVRSRMANEHIWPASQTGTNNGGYHTVVSFQSQTATPSVSVVNGTTQAGVLFSSAGVPGLLYSTGGTPIAVGFVAGMIMAWSGSAASIPAGWVLCNGSNSTPDLRDRFIVGAGTTYAVGDTGGAATVTLDITMIPSHSHSVTILTGGSGLGNGGNSNCSTGATGSTGGGAAHENRPPYYALCFIMKS